MSQRLVLGVDLGTSRVKVVAADEAGVVRAAAHREVRLIHPVPDRAEQDPDDLLAATAEAVREAAAAVADAGGRVGAIACSTAMHSLLALDGDATPLTPVLTWADNRADEEVADLAALPQAGELTRRTGTPIFTMAPLAKLRWFARHEPAIAEHAARWVSVKDYLLGWLTGERVIDDSVASATGLFDVGRRAWDPEALRLAGVTTDQLSAPVSTTAVAGRLLAGPAAALGVEVGLPVVAGAADGCLENLGAGAVDEGSAALTIGTSGAVRAITSRPAGDPGGQLFCYALTDDRWVVGGPISNGGLVLRWARERLLPELARGAEAPYALFDELAAAVPAGAHGLLCLPALVGERAPNWDPDLRGVLIGLDPSHGREHVLRALMEGVAYQLTTVFELLAGAHRISAVHATGGFTSSATWLRIVAGALDRPLVVPRRPEGAAFGAALLGLQALGLADAFALARDLAADHVTVEPSDADRAVYRQTLEIFRGLAQQLRPQFTALAGLRAERPARRP